MTSLDPSTEKTKADLQLHDQAFLNSLLSYGIYSARTWTLDMELKNPLYPDENKLEMLLREANDDISKISLRKIYEAYLQKFNKEHFSAVDLNMPAFEHFKSENYGYNTVYKTRPGYYETLDNLGCAGVFKSQNSDGTYTLHLAFRGTDTNARPFMDFVKGAYLDMSAYYDAFKPLEKYFLEYAKNPKNNISEIHVSGHSLGGSCVQEFFKSKAVQQSHLNFKGFTYGAPGSAKKLWYALLPAAYHFKRNKNFLQLGSVVVDSLMKIVPIAMPFISRFIITPETPPPITHYKHDGDLIPKAGSLGYGKNGTKVLLWDIACEKHSDEFILSEGKALKELALLRKREATKTEKSNFFMKALINTHYYVIKNPPIVLSKAFKFQFHDMLRYITNLDYHIDNILEKNPHINMAENLPHLTSFNIYKHKFESLTKGKYDLTLKESIDKLEHRQAKIEKAVPSVKEVLKHVLTMRMASDANEDLNGKDIAINYNNIKKYSYNTNLGPIEFISTKQKLKS